MHGDSEQKNLEALNEWKDQLVCPACLESLHLAESIMVCAGCGRIYPVVDGIPVLILERAITPK